jgi:hypothetical protein
MLAAVVARVDAVVAEGGESGPRQRRAVRDHVLDQFSRHRIDTNTLFRQRDVEHRLPVFTIDVRVRMFEFQELVEPRTHPG